MGSTTKPYCPCMSTIQIQEWTNGPLAIGKPRIGVTAEIYLDYMMMDIGLIAKVAIGMIG